MHPAQPATQPNRASRSSSSSSQPQVHVRVYTETWRSWQLFFSPLFPSNPMTVSLWLKHENYSPLTEESIQGIYLKFNGLNLAQGTDELNGLVETSVPWSLSTVHYLSNRSRPSVRKKLLYKTPNTTTSDFFHSSRNLPRTEHHFHILFFVPSP